MYCNNRMQTLALLMPARVGLEREIYFHGRQAEVLDRLIRDHVAQCTRRIEVSTALLYPHCLRIRDLYMIDVTPVPDRLENGVVKPENHDVLYGLLTQVVINAVDLVFAQHTSNLAV